MRGRPQVYPIPMVQGRGQGASDRERVVEKVSGAHPLRRSSVGLSPSLRQQARAVRQELFLRSQFGVGVVRGELEDVYNEHRELRKQHSKTLKQEDVHRRKHWDGR